MFDMRRRDFITLLGGAAAAWPVAARAQQPDRMWRIGVLLSQAESDPVARSFTTAFASRLRELGWIEGKNLRIDYRWGGGDATHMPPLAKELVALKPDALLAATAISAAALRQYTLTIPIVFTQVGDPVAFGLVTNLARPSGNITGFTPFDYAIGGKWLEALKECTPSLTRVAVFFESGNPSSTQYVPAIEAAASSLGVGLVPSPVKSDTEIERAFAAFAAEPNSAVIALPTAAVVRHRGQIIALAAKHRLPAIYPYRFFAAEGGLMSYGTDLTHQFRQAALYIDRILKGEKPSGLPVQQPTRFELVVNLKTAKALGLTVPIGLLVRADEVIE
jgi:putative tryptophan/tyrosine transport system substrate-binding protein